MSELGEVPLFQPPIIPLVPPHARQSRVSCLCFQETVTMPAEGKTMTKTELIEVILRASEFVPPTFSWKQIVAIIKTEMIEKKTDEKLDELEILLEKLQSIPEERRIIENDEAHNLMTAIKNNLTECNELYNQ